MRILLPIDGSKWSDEAVRAVITEFRPKGTEVNVLHVIEPIRVYLSAALIPHLVYDSREIETERRKQAAEVLRQGAKKLRAAGFSVTETIEAGDPSKRIIDRAAAWKANLIVLGSHGWRGMKRLLMGSVSEAVMRHAGCSVQVVRAPSVNGTRRSNKLPNK